MPQPVLLPSMALNALPVMYSTLAPQTVVDRVVPQYSVPTVRDCQFWHRGLSDIYLLETVEQPYILRISHSHWRSKAEIEFELELLDYLRQRQISVAYPIRTKDNRLYLEINAPEGKRYASLFIYAPGTVPTGDLNAEQALKLGATVAQMHQASLGFNSSAERPALTVDALLDGSWQVLRPFLNGEDYKYVASAIAQLKTQFQGFPQTAPYWGVCWGDPHSGNAHFTVDGQVTLFDFDQCGAGWRAFEVGKFRQVALNTGVSRTIRAAFLAGYTQVNPLDDFEIEAIPGFTQMAHLWVWSISLTHAQHHNYSRLDHTFFSIRLQQLKKLRSPDWQQF
jgi:Ser/Thr protein kinase RdoA (MazF antagonist)